MGSSWLADEQTRQRLLDIGDEVRPMRNRAFGVLGAAAVAAVPWVGWTSLGCVALALLGFLVNERVMPRVARPELTYFAAWIFAQLMIAVAAATMGGTEAWAICWFALPVMILGTRLTAAGVSAGVAATVLLLLGAVAASAGLGDPVRPEVLIAVIALVIGCGILSVALMHSDLQHREEAIVDPLTQVLNRGALAPRARELEAQSANHGQPVAAVMGDIDHFKRLNDGLGHATGDAALRDVAYRLRASLRAYDAVYRLGGEEFLVLLPGADDADGRRLAEQLRRAVVDEPIVGQRITMSFGVAATTTGERFVLEQLLERADADLYAAKAAGRDRVGGGDATAAGDAPLEPAALV